MVYTKSQTPDKLELIMTGLFVAFSVYIPECIVTIRTFKTDLCI
jgi:hypothetical protein